MNAHFVPTPDVQDMLNWLMDIVQRPESEFNPSKQAPGYSALKRTSDQGEGEIILRATMEFPDISPEELSVMNNDLVLRREWDDLLADITTLERLNEFT